MCPKNRLSLDLDPDLMDLMDLDLNLDPIHLSLTLGFKAYKASKSTLSMGVLFKILLSNAVRTR